MSSAIDEKVVTMQERPLIGLAEAVADLRAELLRAQSAASQEEGLKLPISAVTVELQLVATASADGRAGFRVPLINLELGGTLGMESQLTHKISLTFGPPTDEWGHMINIGQQTSSSKG